MHLHLDLTGGIAGDMFVAAMLDTFPELEPQLRQSLDFMTSEIALRLEVADRVNSGISGKHFNVCLMETHAESDEHEAHHTHSHDSHHHADDEDHHHSEHHHFHRSWKDIRHYIEHSPLADSVKQIATGIFGLLAEAEAKVHHKDVEDVQFHEVGAWDCIADILSAAWLIDACGAMSWSVSKLPWGGGTVKCAHGIIPVPAPATLNLLQGYQFIDDGESGERITPTGAAILAWLAPSQRIPGGTLKTTGYGVGTKQFATIPNILRISAFASAPVKLSHERITIIQCDIDDMSGELLAIARENLRKVTGVLEVTESVSHGKKNRFINTLTLLCKPDNFPEVQTAVFEQTSTLGIRYWSCDRTVLPRDELQQGIYQTKVAQRPGGYLTCKVEADHLSGLETHQQREQFKRNLEQQVEESLTHGSK